MKINHVKTIALVICCAVVLIFISGCSNKINENDGVTDISDSNDDNGYNISGDNGDNNDGNSFNTDYLPKYDLEGRDFKILAWGYPGGMPGQDLGNFFYAEEENGDIINDAIYTRNGIVGERFNFKMNTILENNTGYTSRMSNSINAGDKEFDLFVMHTAQNTQVALTGNMVCNWNDIKCVDLNKPWWNQSIRELVDVNGFLPVMVSDYLYSSLIFTSAMIYNKNMHQNYELESIYKMVEENKWTLDNFYSMIKPLTMDVNGDGIMNENDQYGFSSNITTHAVGLSYGAGIRTITLEKDSVPVLSLYSEKSVTFVEKIYDMFYSDKIVFICEHDTPCPISWDADRVFIQTIWLSELPRYRNTGSDFGIIPFPKWDSNQDKYYTYTDGLGGVIGIPSYCDDPEMVGAVVEALSAESRKTLLPAYYDLTLNTKFVRDEESKKMLDIIFDGRVYDFGYVYRNPTNPITYYIQQCLSDQNRNLTSYYEAQKDMWQTWFESIYNNYMDVSAR